MKHRPTRKVANLPDIGSWQTEERRTIHTIKSERSRWGDLRKKASAAEGIKIAKTVVGMADEMLDHPDEERRAQATFSVTGYVLSITKLLGDEPYVVGLQNALISSAGYGRISTEYRLYRVCLEELCRLLPGAVLRAWAKLRQCRDGVSEVKLLKKLRNRAIYRIRKEVSSWGVNPYLQGGGGHFPQGGVQLIELFGNDSDEGLSTLLAKEEYAEKH